MDSEINATDLAALIGSRICHDLISPIGAIANGLELLNMTGGHTGPELDLISDSAGNAGARIGFFRIAYGAAGPQIMARSEICALLDALTAGSRLLTDWQPAEPQSRRDVRLAFLALQCCESALPYGGSLTFSHGEHWLVTGRAPTINVDPTLWGSLNDPAAAEVSAATVQFALLALHARQEDRKLSAAWDKECVTIRF